MPRRVLGTGQLPRLVSAAGWLLGGHGGRHMVANRARLRDGSGGVGRVFSDVRGAAGTPHSSAGGAMFQSPGPCRVRVVMAAGAAIISPVTPDRSVRTLLPVPPLSGRSRG